MITLPRGTGRKWKNKKPPHFRGVFVIIVLERNILTDRHLPEVYAKV